MKKYAVGSLYREGRPDPKREIAVVTARDRDGELYETFLYDEEDAELWILLSKLFPDRPELELVSVEMELPRVVGDRLSTELRKEGKQGIGIAGMVDRARENSLRLQYDLFQLLWIRDLGKQADELLSRVDIPEEYLKRAWKFAEDPLE